MVLSKKYIWMFSYLIAALLVLSGCGGTSNAEPEGDLTLLNELGEEITLTNKERATILFHFTEVG